MSGATGATSVRSGEWVEMRSTSLQGDGARNRWRQGTANARRLARRVRNDQLVDWWSATHFAWAVVLGLAIGPLWAFALLVAWEPFEILVLGPLLSRKGIAFGHEGWRNSLSDIVFDGAGALLAYAVALTLWDPLGVV